MHRSLATVLCAIILANSASASSRSDLKAGYAAVLHHEYEKAIAFLTEAIDAGDLKPKDLALAYHWRGAEHRFFGAGARACLRRVSRSKPTSLAPTTCWRRPTFRR